MADLSIGAVARAAGVNVETIRFYQLKGLLAKPPKPYGGIRRYSAEDVARIKFVKSAQRLGFRLQEVAELLKLEDGAHCDEARALAQAKLSDIRERLTNLRRIESALTRLIARCATATGNVACPLITSLREPRHAKS